MKTTRARMLLVAPLLLAAAWLVVAEAPEQEKDVPTIAQIYYIKAKTGKLDEYNRYILEVAAPIDEEAKKSGAFLSLTTLISNKPDAPWTHMRVFALRDRAQLQNLSRLLDEAKLRLEPDADKRKKRDEYAATLRDFVGEEVMSILH
jgi:hypothetical protein